MREKKFCVQVCKHRSVEGELEALWWGLKGAPGVFPSSPEKQAGWSFVGRAGGGAEATSHRPLTVCLAGVILSCDTVVLKNPKL